MKDLIERLKNANGPDGWLDDAIHELMPKPKVVIPLKYTRSIDDALTILPAGSRLRELGQWDDNGQPGGWYCDINCYCRTESGWAIRSFSYGIPDPMDYHQKVPPLASNAALAICIAALEMRLAVISKADAA